MLFRSFLLIKSNIVGNKTIIGMITDSSVFGYIEVDFTPTFILNDLLELESNSLTIIAENQIRWNNISNSYFSSNHFLNPFIRMNYGKWVSLSVVGLLLLMIFVELNLMKICASYVFFFLSKDRNTSSRSSDNRDILSTYSDESLDGTKNIVIDYQLKDKNFIVDPKDKGQIFHYKYN